MSEAKTKPTGASVKAFLDAIDDEARRRDCRAILAVMRRATGAAPKMWGAAIIGLGIRRITYAGGREADWPRIALSPRKQDLTLYLPGLKESGALLRKLGKHKAGKGCLYLKRLSDVDLAVLEAIIERSAAR